MTASAVIALLTELLVNMPTILKTGQEVMGFINDAYEKMRAAIGNRKVTPEEIDELVKQIVLNSAAIQAIGDNTPDAPPSDPTSV